MHNFVGGGSALKSVCFNIYNMVQSRIEAMAFDGMAAELDKDIFVWVKQAIVVLNAPIYFLYIYNTFLMFNVLQNQWKTKGFFFALP